jgi:hypothetical protein
MPRECLHPLLSPRGVWLRGSRQGRRLNEQETCRRTQRRSHMCMFERVRGGQSLNG